MEIILFKLVGRAYLGHELFDDKYCTLMEFLSSDVGAYGEVFKKFVNDSNEVETSSNYCCLVKESDHVFIGCQLDESPYEDCIGMSYAEFVSILDQWGKLVDAELPEIVVFKEGDSYRLEGRQ